MLKKRRTKIKLIKRLLEKSGVGEYDSLMTRDIRVVENMILILFNTSHIFESGNHA